MRRSGPATRRQQSTQQAEAGGEAKEVNAREEGKEARIGPRKTTTPGGRARSESANAGKNTVSNQATEGRRAPRREKKRSRQGRRGQANKEAGEAEGQQEQRKQRQGCRK